MPRLPHALLLFAVVVAAGCGKSGDADQDAPKGKLHTIKIKQFGDVGSKVKVRYAYNHRMFTHNENPAGKLASKDASTQNVEEAWTEVVLAAGDPPAEFQRTYSEALAEKKGNKFRRTFAGRTILYTRAGDHYDLAAEGGPLQDPNDLPFANAAVDEPDYFTPPNPVRVGDAWPVDPALGLPGNADLDRGKSTGEAHLESVYEQEGATCGTIVVKLKLVFREQTLELDIVFDGAIDGSSTQSKRVTTGHFVSDRKLAGGGSTLITTDSTTTIVRSAETAAPKPVAPTKEKEKAKEKMKEKAKEQTKPKDTASGERGASAP